MGGIVREFVSRGDIILAGANQSDNPSETSFVSSSSRGDVILAGANQSDNPSETSFASSSSRGRRLCGRRSRALAVQAFSFELSERWVV